MEDLFLEDIYEYIKHEDGCHIWQGGTHPQGYPLGRYQKRMQLIARVLLSDKLDEELVRSERIKRTCDNSLCVNPDHHFVSKPGDVSYHRGGHHSLTETQERELYDKYHAEKDKWGIKSRLLREYNVADSVLRRIIERGPSGRKDGTPKPGPRNYSKKKV